MSSQHHIFRTIEVLQGTHLTLGAPVSAEARQHMTPAPGGGLQMEPGSFGQAKSIIVQLDGDGHVTSMAFTYDDGTSYDEMLARFTEELGPPSQPAADSSQSTIWTDAHTRFELFEQNSDVSSNLIDLKSSAAS